MKFKRIFYLNPPSLVRAVLKRISIIKLKSTSFLEKIIENALFQIERFSFILWCVSNVPHILQFPLGGQL